MIRDIYAVGKLRSELIVKKRGSELTVRSFDGHKLDEVNINCTLLSREDCQQLIDFLKITKECFPAPKDQNQKQDRPGLIWDNFGHTRGG